MTIVVKHRLFQARLDFRLDTGLDLIKLKQRVRSLKGDEVAYYPVFSNENNAEFLSFYMTISLSYLTFNELSFLIIAFIFKNIKNIFQSMLS